MALRFLGQDPLSPNGDSPTIWEDGTDYILRGFVVTDRAALSEIGPIPEHETVIRFPKRMMAFFPEVKGGAGADA
ncbi:hypothetical protein AB0K48_06360 [Nonomuraea sp. NPDC055795]